MTAPFERRFLSKANANLLVGALTLLGFVVASSSGEVLGKLGFIAAIALVGALVARLRFVATERDVGHRCGPFGLCVDRQQVIAVAKDANGVRVWGERQVALVRSAGLTSGEMDALAAYLHVPVVSGSGLLGRPSAVIAARTRRRSLFLRRLVLLVVPWAAFVIPSLAVMAFTTAPLNLSRLLPRNTALIGGLSAGVLLRERSYLFVVVGMAVLNVAYCVCWAVLDPADPPQLFLAPLRLVVAVAAYFTERGRWFR